MNVNERPGHVSSLLRRIYLACFSALVIALMIAGSQRAAIAKTVVTDQGPITNGTNPNNAGFYPMNATEYLGIPYAAPPVGNLRWRPPQPPAPFKGLFQADGSLTQSCPQPDGLGGVFGDENCLFLNVYVPNIPQPAHGFPVMVWIHGGGLVTGFGAFYDPQRLVDEGGVIVVTINYRLGYLGFLAQHALDSEGHLAGNYGLMDQQLALQWVHRNIGAFGGDRNRVTIFGESAGGLSVYSNLASPTAAGLFQRAIAESGAYSNFAGFFPFTDYLVDIVSLPVGELSGTPQVPSGMDVAKSVGCASQTAACLRAVPESTLVLAEPSGLYPFVDGTVLTKSPGEAIGSGQFNQVPVISGSNHDEYRYFVAVEYDLGPLGPLTDAGYPAAVYALLGIPGPPTGNAFADFLINILYPLSNYTPPAPFLVSAPLALGALGTDLLFACPARNADLSLSQYVPTYAYEFHDETAPSIFPPLSFPPGDYHSVELLYLFNFGLPFTSDQQTLSNTMVAYWTDFAKTGTPNSTGLPNWPEYGATSEFQSLIAPTPAPEMDSDFDSGHKCSKFWDTF